MRRPAWAVEMDPGHGSNPGKKYITIKALVLLVYHLMVHCQNQGPYGDIYLWVGIGGRIHLRQCVSKEYYITTCIGNYSDFINF